jgi:hypothetical protein
MQKILAEFNLAVLASTTKLPTLIPANISGYTVGLTGQTFSQFHQ